MRLLHFSDDPAIGAFEPRPIRVPVDRDPDWLIGPPVWATDGPHALIHLFPRGCPRVRAGLTADTSPEDRAP